MEPSSFENSLTAWSTACQAVFTLVAVLGAVWIGIRQGNYMKEQNKISKEQNQISTEQTNISEEQTKIANKQAEIAEVQAKISNDSFELERNIFFLENVYSPVINDLMNINEILKRLKSANNFPLFAWGTYRNKINICVYDIEGRSMVDKQNESLYKDCIESIKSTVYCVDRHLKQNTFVLSGEFYREYEEEYSKYYEMFFKEYRRLTAILLR